MLLYLKEEIATHRKRAVGRAAENAPCCPKIPMLKKIIMERAGTGGDEAALFTADSLHMYCVLLKTMDTELLSSHPTDIVGLRKYPFPLKGGAYSWLKFEKGYTVFSGYRLRSRGAVFIPLQQLLQYYLKPMKWNLRSIPRS